jgi:hypothetical protein
VQVKRRSKGPREWLVALSLAAGSQAAHADLMLHPTRIVFEKNVRSAQVELINSGTQPETYRITLVNRRMTNTGEFTAADPPVAGEHFATELLRYSPRQVTLPAGAAQIIRLQLRKPADLAVGEYRSHLQFERVPDAVGAADLAARASQTAPGEVGVQLNALIAVSIPVIVRHGELAAQVRLSTLEVVPPAAAGQQTVVAAVMERSGDRSVYGDLVVTWIDAAGTAREVGRAAGVAVYTPNAQRRVRIPVQWPAGQTVGVVRVVYLQRQEEGGKPMAEATVTLP